MKNKNIFKTTLLVAIVSVFLVNQGCNKDEDHNGNMTEFSLEFKHTVHGHDFVSGEDYTDHDSTQTYNFSKIRYYISNVKFLGHSNEVLAAFDSYFLIDGDKTIDLGMIDFGDDASIHYHMLTFDIGIRDSMLNHCDRSHPDSCSAIPDDGQMYWVWATGHRFIRLEGTANGSTPFEFHVGRDELLRDVAFLVHQDIDAGSHKTMELELDLAQVIHNDSTGIMINLATENSTHSTDIDVGSLAYKVAENFSKSFTFEGASNHGKK